MYIYSKEITNFLNNGLGVLNDVIRAEVTEVLNGEMSISFEYPIGSLLSNYLVEENIVKVNVGEGNLQLFRIKYVEMTSTRIKVYAIHIFYDLVDNMLIDVAPTGLNCQAALAWILSRTSTLNSYTAFSDIAITASAKYVRLNPIEAILSAENSLVAKYSAELERDNFTIRLLNRRGADNKVKLLFGKNIKEINISTDSTTISTRIMPLGFDALMLPEVFVNSPKINNYPKPKIAKIEFSNVKYDPADAEAFQTEEEAFEELRRLSNILFSDFNIDTPQINIKVDWVELSKTKEYFDKYSALETVRLGDTITAELYGINFKTRCIKTIYDVLLDRVVKFEIGTFQPTFISSTAQQIKSINDAITQINPVSLLNKAQENATNQITTAMGGYVYKTQNELFIMDTDNTTTAIKVWRWNLGGLGYSSSGVNGPYETAITQDGAIVADFITVGSMATSRISGLNTTLSGLSADIVLNSQDIQFNVSSIGTAQTTANTAITNASNAQAKADTAFTNAGTAQTTANTGVANALTANNLLADIANDDRLTPIEKQDVKLEWDVILSEKALNNTQATNFAVTTENTNYNTSFQTLATYLNNGTTWSSGTPSWLATLTTTQVIVGTTFRANFKDYYDKRTLLLNAIATKAKALADSKAEYAQVVGLETSLDGLQTNVNANNTAIGANATLITNKLDSSTYTEYVKLSDAQIGVINANALIEKGKINVLTGLVDEHATTVGNIKTNFIFDINGMEIGKSNSPFKMHLSNTSLEFKNSGTLVAGIGTGSMLIPNAIVNESAIVGKHKIEKLAGNITIVRFIG